jgi:hypothetical protein
MFFISLLCIIEWCFVLRIGIIHPQLGLGGDGEIVASRIARALTEIGYEARIYAITFSGGDDIAEAARLIGSSDVKVIYREPSKMLRMLEDRVFKGRFQRLKRLMMFKQLYPTARGESDILIDTGTNMLTKTDAVYIHFLRIGAAVFSAILFSVLAVFIASMLMFLLSLIDRHLDQMSQ